MTKNYVFTLALMIAFLTASNAKADWVGGDFYAADFYRFVCTFSSDKSVPYQQYFEMKISATETGVGIDFYANVGGASLGYDDNKFKDWLIVDPNHFFDAKYGSLTISGETYNNAINLAGTGKLPTTYYLDFGGNYSWNDFAMAIESGSFIMLGGHVQELPQTLNKGLFTWDGVGGKNPTSAATPEPATMLLFGAGLMVLPLARRFRKK